MSLPKHIRAPSRLIDYTRSFPQKKRNKAFKTCANFWTKNFTHELLYAWMNFSNFGETPYNAFIRINIHRVFNDLDIDPTPPRDV